MGGSKSIPLDNITKSEKLVQQTNNKDKVSKVILCITLCNIDDVKICSKYIFIILVYLYIAAYIDSSFFI